MTQLKTQSASLLFVILATGVLSGCANHDRQHVQLLGGAMDHNTAVQAVRDVNESDPRSVEGPVE